MILIKFTFALLTLLPISSAAPAERTELSVVAGDTPRSVRITGPKSLTDLGKRKYGKWVGCSFPFLDSYVIFSGLAVRENVRRVAT
jgi:hypothetical protein